MITENSKSFEEFHGAARANRMNSRVSNNQHDIRSWGGNTSNDSNQNNARTL